MMENVHIITERPRTAWYSLTVSLQEELREQGQIQAES
jgi:hypothetical protein